MKRAALTSDDLTPIATEVFGFLMRDEYDELNNRLRSLCAKPELHCMEAAMYLRASWTRGDLLPDWEPLRDHAITLCEQQELPVEHVLFGLLKDDE